MMAMEQPDNFTSTFNLSATHTTHSKNPMDLVAAALLGLCCVVGLPGNTAVLVVFSRRLEKDNFTQRLILSLACCDLLCLVTIPMWMYALLHGWDLGSPLCKFISFLLFWSLCTNVQIVTLMSVQRYIQVLHRHSWARLGHRGEGALLLALWGLAGVMTAPSVSTWGTRNGPYACNRYGERDRQKLATVMFETLVLFVLPLTVIVTTYFCLQRKVRRKAQFSGTQRMTRLIIRIILIFVIVWVPIHVVNVMEMITILLNDSRPDLAAELGHFKDKLEVFSRCVTVVGAAVDPFLYAFAFRRIWLNSRQTKTVENSVKNSVESVV